MLFLAVLVVLAWLYYAIQFPHLELQWKWQNLGQGQKWVLNCQ